MSEGVRIDKWLWAVRVYKTRSLAAENIRNGRVTIGGQVVKASRDVKINDIIVVNSPPLTRTVKVLQLLHNRVSAKLVADNMEDLTPQSEYDKLKMPKESFYVFRPRGSGRPTKKDRRELEDFF
jgi:ribosome-associated heat shock protein Hsp15